jgi:hypothetical protein
MRNGDPCAKCGGPMFVGQALDVDHYPGRMFGGPQITRLAHRYCNRRAGAIMREAKRRAIRQTTVTTPADRGPSDGDRGQ